MSIADRRTEHPLLERECALASVPPAIDPSYLASARNLVHYFELRRSDLRPLQERLARLGASSLGRSESQVLANLNKAVGILHRLARLDWTGATPDEPAGINSSRALFKRPTQALFGATLVGRRVRIMMTLPTEAVVSYGLVRKPVAAGMDVARIDWAPDNAAHWRTMAVLVRGAARAARAAGAHPHGPRRAEAAHRIAVPRPDRAEAEAEARRHRPSPIPTGLPGGA